MSKDLYMRLAFTCLLLFFVCNTYAQQGIESLINAEKSFAAYSVQHGMKEAFLQYLDSAGIVFEKGKAVNGIQSWNSKENEPGILNWHPQRAEISMANDLGYTTGPWTYQQSSIEDSVLARGQYSTVWRKDKNGEWKFVIDIGSSYSKINPAMEAEKVDVEKINAKSINLASMVKAEEDFIKIFKKDRKKAYTKYLSQKSVLNYPKMLPATAAEDQTSNIDSMPSDLQLAISGSRIATSGDLGYVFGTTLSKGRNQNFLHVWRKEQNGWKIALEVLQY